MDPHKDSYTSPEVEEANTLEETVVIALRIGKKALEVLKTPIEAMETDDVPEIALVELAPDVYTLSGRTIEEIAELRQGPLLKINEIDMRKATPSDIPDSVRLLLGKKSLEALEVDRSSMDGWCPPQFGLTPFGNVYRLGGDLIADYVMRRGAQEVRSSNLDENGQNITGENSFN